MQKIVVKTKKINFKSMIDYAKKENCNRLVIGLETMKKDYIKFIQIDIHKNGHSIIDWESNMFLGNFRVNDSCYDNKPIAEQIYSLFKIPNKELSVHVKFYKNSENEISSYSFNCENYFDKN